MVTLTNEQIVNNGFLYVNGLQLSNDATTPNSLIDVAAGICRDSTNTYDMTLGNYLGANPNLTANTATVASILVNGVNGLDTGTVAASTMYAVHVITDPTENPSRPAGLLISLSATAPLLPFGYGAFRLIGFILIDGSSHILKAYWQVSNGGVRTIQYDAPIAVTVTASGTSATYSAMDLSVGVPVTNYGKVWVQFKWTPAAAANALNFQPTGATGDYKTTLGIVASVAQEETFMILPLTASSKPEISYKTSAGTLNNVFVQAYEYSI